MAITKPFDFTVLNRARKSKSFRCSLLESAINELLNGDISVAKILINHYINASISLQRDEDTQSIDLSRLKSIFSDSATVSTHILLDVLREVQIAEDVSIRTRVYIK